MNECVIPISGRTNAERAKRIALSHGIPASVVSVDPSVTENGCSVGLRLMCAYAAEMLGLLDRSGIQHGGLIGWLK